MFVEKIFQKISKQKTPTQSIDYEGFILWASLGSNQGPPDYESGALTN